MATIYWLNPDGTRDPEPLSAAHALERVARQSSGLVAEYVADDLDVTPVFPGCLDAMLARADAGLLEIECWCWPDSFGVRTAGEYLPGMGTSFVRELEGATGG